MADERVEIGDKILAARTAAEDDATVFLYWAVCCVGFGVLCVESNC